jgi:hypothetical protein
MTLIPRSRSRPHRNGGSASLGTSRAARPHHDDAPTRVTSASNNTSAQATRNPRGHQHLSRADRRRPRVTITSVERDDSLIVAVDSSRSCASHGSQCVIEPCTASLADGRVPRGRASTHGRSHRVGHRADQPVVECGQGQQANIASSGADAPADSAQPDDRRDAGLVTAAGRRGTPRERLRTRSAL